MVIGVCFGKLTRKAHNSTIKVVKSGRSKELVVGEHLGRPCTGFLDPPDLLSLPFFAFLVLLCFFLASLPLCLSLRLVPLYYRKPVYVTKYGIARLGTAYSRGLSHLSVR